MNSSFTLPAAMTNTAVDLVCDNYIINKALFSGSLAGPVSQRDPDGNQYEGVKRLSDGRKKVNDIHENN